MLRIKKNPLFGADAVQKNTIDKNRIEVEFSLFGDLTESKVFNTT